MRLSQDNSTSLRYYYFTLEPSHSTVVICLPRMPFGIDRVLCPCRCADARGRDTPRALEVIATAQKELIDAAQRRLLPLA
eukprot:COSAG06_NODE_58763_length_276_cov_0.587571_1_plen_79_part_10